MKSYIENNGWRRTCRVDAKFFSTLSTLFQFIINNALNLALLVLIILIIPNTNMLILLIIILILYKY